MALLRSFLPTSQGTAPPLEGNLGYVPVTAPSYDDTMPRPEREASTSSTWVSDGRDSLPDSRSDLIVLTGLIVFGGRGTLDGRGVVDGREGGQLDEPGDRGDAGDRTPEEREREQG